MLGDTQELRRISNIFYRLNGTYQKFCNYAAMLFRYDWYVSVERRVEDIESNKKKILDEFREILYCLDNSHIKKICGDIALAVVKDGAYYGYRVDCVDSITIQQLPIKYCRCRFYKGTLPVVEFNMKFFDEKFPDLKTRQAVLKMFPPEFEKGYHLYHQHKLPADNILDSYGCYYALEPGYGIKFSLSDSIGDDLPLFVNTIPSLLDLETAQNIDRARQLQQLRKVFIQKIPLDKNNDLIFDVDEARDIHNNAVEMLSGAPGVEVLTTFTDVQVEDLADSSSNSTNADTLERAERTVYNNAGVSHNLFNTEGQVALEKSILMDEAQLRTLVLQFHMFFDAAIMSRFKKHNKKWVFRFYMLETTQNNYQAMSKLYKEQTQIGFQKILPQIALGHSQSSILNGIYFENVLLELSTIMIPPLMSSTLNGEDILKPKNGAGTAETGEPGRPPKEDSEKSAKTLQNLESQS